MKDTRANETKEIYDFPAARNSHLTGENEILRPATELIKRHRITCPPIKNFAFLQRVTYPSFIPQMIDEQS